MTPKKGSKKKVNSKPKETARPIFNPDAILQKVQKDIKSMKTESKSLQAQIKEEQAALENERLIFQQKNSKEAQMEAIKGKEHFKLSRLKRMGFDEQLILEHLEIETQKIQTIADEKQKEKTDVNRNITKMKRMNEECRKAVNAAEADVNDNLAKATKLKEELDEAEVKLYSLENKVKLARRTKGVSIFWDKSSLRDGIKDIAHEVRLRSHDRQVIEKVLQVAGRCLAVGIELSSSHHSGTESDSDEDSVEISDASSDESSDEDSIR
jgi:chromosome segregation ATPase